MLNTKFDEYLEFPCSFSYKIVGDANETLVDDVVAVVQKHVPGHYVPGTKTSSKGTYHSISISVTVQSTEQIESLYMELAAIEGVKRVL